ncbi:hypothetical protein EYF80_013500 [Liparis tanakae]|uniref:Uncharacterized protein n=1 Tax=Liparis tanakae TaxID=230148 RepID=A0A4Z2IFY8_9TELE|nr:hypothetical protein EYF80_013500 [Liparis tanakae]
MKSSVIPRTIYYRLRDSPSPGDLVLEPTWRRLRVTWTSCQALSLNFPLAGSTRASKAPEPRLMTSHRAPFLRDRLT